jgi:hypothetical protein
LLPGIDLAEILLPQGGNVVKIDASRQGKLEFSLAFRREARNTAVLTINALLILKVRDIIFFSRAKDTMGHFVGFFEGAETFLTPKLT